MTREKSLEQTVENALRQIEEKKYDEELLARGISRKRIQHYGFAFRGKKVLIGTEE
ncbi:PD-(D/E)XK nuclease domain-containing protein [Dorea sp.]